VRFSHQLRMSLTASAAVATALFAATPAVAAFVTTGQAGAPPQVHGPGTVGQAVAGAAAPEPQVSWTASASGAGAVLTAAAACTALSLAAARRSIVTGARTIPPPAGRRLVHLAAFESELGVQDPVGFWDPLGFATDGDVTAFKRRRSVELKHGRISMLATMGYITPELTGKWPGDLSPSAGVKFADVPTGLAAISKVPALGWAQIVAYCGFCELSAGSDDWKTGTPGNFGWKVLTSKDPEELQKKLAAEVANGRLAMVAIIGMFFQDGLTGSAWGDWALYTDSPLRAFESEMGAQPPLGFWDPLGLAAEGDEKDFRRRRETEIKHGRISMLATMGYITPEITGKFPGMLSPSQGLAFADIPNGLGAISKVPFNGWIQIVAYCLYCEAAGLGFKYADDSEPGERNWKPPLLATADPERRKKRLAAELANGRLAMVAIIGMFFQDGLTGSAWGDWSLYTDSPLRALDLTIERGVQDPVGFWDPLGLAADGDEAAFKRRRSVELKHGRVSMAACIGYIVPEYYKFPGDISPSLGLKFADIPNGLAAISKVPALGWVQIVFFAGIIEGTFGVGEYKTGTPGEYNWKVLTSNDPEEKEKKLRGELANGRLAMVAIIGMFFQDGLTGGAWGDWASYTDSPLRAFESELGVQDPVGFWDPVGFTADGDQLAFKRRRCVELKHGRISMLATMGYITPEVVGKWPGYLSPSLDLKFADIPNGLGAVTKVPALGWVQIFAYAGLCELTGPRTRAASLEDYASITPGDYGWKVLSSNDPEELRKKLAAEVANSRLAMVAILGMFFQDGLTGSAWGDWALYTDSPLR